MEKEEGGRTRVLRESSECVPIPTTDGIIQDRSICPLPALTKYQSSDEESRESETIIASHTLSESKGIRR
jgi:hypothetical protein